MSPHICLFCFPLSALQYVKKYFCACSSAQSSLRSSALPSSAGLRCNSSPRVFSLTGADEESAGVRSLPLTSVRRECAERQTDRQTVHCNKDSDIRTTGKGGDKVFPCSLLLTSNHCFFPYFSTCSLIPCFHPLSCPFICLTHTDHIYTVASSVLKAVEARRRGEKQRS